MKLNSLLKKSWGAFALKPKKIAFLPGNTQLQKRSEDVELRGLHIKEQREDLPSLIFFVDMFDRVESWLNFFTHPDFNVPSYRNVYVLYPRNQGNSDYCNQRLSAIERVEQFGKDVERFMYKNKISTATFGGHGLGAKYALLAAINKPQNVTGYFALDYSPLNYNYYDFAQTWKHVLENLSGLNFNKLGRTGLLQYLA